MLRRCSSKSFNRWKQPITSGKKNPGSYLKNKAILKLGGGLPRSVLIIFSLDSCVMWVSEARAKLKSVHGRQTSLPERPYVCPSACLLVQSCDADENQIYTERGRGKGVTCSKLWVLSPLWLCSPSAGLCFFPPGWATISVFGWESVFQETPVAHMKHAGLMPITDINYLWLVSGVNTFFAQLTLFNVKYFQRQYYSYEVLLLMVCPEINELFFRLRMRSQ